MVLELVIRGTFGVCDAFTAVRLPYVSFMPEDLSPYFPSSSLLPAVSQDRPQLLQRCGLSLSYALLGLWGGLPS